MKRKDKQTKEKESMKEEERRRNRKRKRRREGILPTRLYRGALSLLRTTIENWTQIKSKRSFFVCARLEIIMSRLKV
jgi:hypothetical protein